MQFNKSIYFVVVVTVMGLSVTVFKASSTNVQQNVRVTSRETYQDRVDRYPVVEADESEPNDPVKKAKLKKQKQRYDKDAPFTNPGPNDEELAFRPESQFNFPALPVIKSEVIVVGQVQRRSSSFH